ncbi:hypothetical protein ACFSTA_08860 [Ornithinibacillus salinisoli]|uniref:Uncharacterized protein n=1 Tax=Ornithinibacillus salinisoli TaxID=1848459 RepID=A0ABW4VYX6_9BACI
MSYVDALCGAPLAALYNSSLLLTHRDYLPISEANSLVRNRHPNFFEGYIVIGITPRSIIQRYYNSKECSFYN